MITTVVTSITSTVTSVTSVMGFGVTLGLVTVISLAAFLCARELATASGSSSRRSLAKFLEVGIVPLIIVFAMIVIMAVVEVLA